VSDLYERIYDIVRAVPVGRVTTYGAIARVIGIGRSSRMVGYALNAVADDMSIPCHRVVNRNGELSGRMHFATPTLMRELLESEEITFVGEAVDMAQHFWDPGSASPGGQDLRS
jgi:methylated-DNA-protein-cysteine methyltransferase related protein